MTIIDWINQLLVHKKDWNEFSETDQKSFNSYIINRWLSMDAEFIEIVNFFQKYSIGTLKSRDVYKWYCDVLPRGKRFNKYIKGKKSKKQDTLTLDILCKYFEVSRTEVSEYYEMLTKKEIKSILLLYGVK